jgi:dienelactone hydrolase
MRRLSKVFALWACALAAQELPAPDADLRISALGDPVLAMRIRDGLASLAWLRAPPGVDPELVVVGGHGMGGIVALHVAAIDGGLRRAVEVKAAPS